MAERKLTNAEATKIRQEVAKQTKAQQRSVARKVVTKGAKSQWQGFTDFMRTQGVVGLAVGLVLGVQVKAVVDQIVASFINPTLGLILPGTESLDKKKFVIELASKEPAEFTYGAFISVMISFTTVALLVYYGVKALKLDKLDKKT